VVAQADPFTTFNFLVELTVPDASGLGLDNPLCDGAFAEVDGLEMTMEPRTVREGGNNTQQTQLVGRVTYGNLTLKRGMTANQDLWRWFAAATGPRRRGVKANGVIVMRDGALRPRVRFSLTGCLPIRLKAPPLNAKDGILAIEELQLACGSFTVEPA
jgi:phage tail-like protein